MIYKFSQALVEKVEKYLHVRLCGSDAIAYC